jgi:hypothetical protein
MADDGGDNIFLYLGGEQEVPRGVTHVCIDRSVKIIPRLAFDERANLVSVETHDELEIIEDQVFEGWGSLRGIKLSGVKEVKLLAFYNCRALTDAEFGDNLEIIGGSAFVFCPLRSINIPTVRTIGRWAFEDCEQLTDVELGDKLERIGIGAFAER